MACLAGPALPFALRIAGRLLLGLARRQALRDLLLRAAGEHAPGECSMSQPGTASASRFLIISHSLPLPRFFIWTRANSPFSFSPCRRNFRSPRAICSSTGRVAEQFPRAAVPQHDAARAVISGRDVAFEVAVFERMVFHLGGQVLGERLERRAFGNRPGNQRAVDLQAEIVMQARGIVPLHVEARRGAGGTRLPALVSGGGSGVFSNLRLRTYSSSAIKPCPSSIYMISSELSIINVR